MEMMKKLVWMMALPLLLAGCTSYRNVPYLQNPEAVNSFAEKLPLYDAKIMPKDLLTITVNTTDSLFNFHRIPWKIIINHVITELIVQTFTANFGE